MATAKKTTAAKPAAKKVEKFDLANLRLVEKRTYGYFGDPAGYEESLYVTFVLVVGAVTEGLLT